MKRLVVIIERPDGTTFEQEVGIVENGTEKSIKRIEKAYGKDYRVVAHYEWEDSKNK